MFTRDDATWAIKLHSLTWLPLCSLLECKGRKGGAFFLLDMVHLHKSMHYPDSPKFELASTTIGIPRRSFNQKNYLIRRCTVFSDNTIQKNSDR